MARRLICILILLPLVMPVSAQSRFAGKALGATEMRTRTGVSVIAVLREGTAIPAPGPDDVLLGGDTVVVVGLANGMANGLFKIGLEFFEHVGHIGPGTCGAELGRHDHICKKAVFCVHPPDIT